MDEAGKPEGAKLGWTLMETAYPFATQWLKVRQDRVNVAGVGEISYSYVESAGAVFIVPVTAGGDVVLIEEYRYPADRTVLAVPAGGLGDRAGADPADVARHELAEEAGATCAELLYIASFYPIAGMSDDLARVYLALDVQVGAAQHLEALERITVRPTPVKEALRLARTGGITSGGSALALLMCEERLRERGYGV